MPEISVIIICSSMKLPRLLAASLMGNLVLAAVFVVLRQGSSAKVNTPPPAALPPATVQTEKPFPAATATPGTATPWSLIASADPRQYISNLRAVGCPEWLIRDLLVAAIDVSYQQKAEAALVYSPAGLGTDQNRQASPSILAKRFGLIQEKTALLKSLLG